MTKLNKSILNGFQVNEVYSRNLQNIRTDLV